MSNAIFRISDLINEEVRSYFPHPEEIQKLMLTYRKMYAAIWAGKVFPTLFDPQGRGEYLRGRTNVYGT